MCIFQRFVRSPLRRNRDWWNFNLREPLQVDVRRCPQLSCCLRKGNSSPQIREQTAPAKSARSHANHKSREWFTASCRPVHSLRQIAGGACRQAREEKAGRCKGLADANRTYWNEFPFNRLIYSFECLLQNIEHRYRIGLGGVSQRYALIPAPNGIFDSYESPICSSNGTSRNPEQCFKQAETFKIFFRLQTAVWGKSLNIFIS